MGKSKIEWTEQTWNPVRGCSRVSTGCENCYAERFAARFCDATKPFAGFAEMRHGEPRWTGSVVLVPNKLREPLTWQKPARVFVNSMSDLFHEKLSNEDIAAVFGVMAACENEQRGHTFQILTKRAKRMTEWFEWIEGRDGSGVSHPVRSCGQEATKYLGVISTWLQGGMQGWPLPNVWLGVSVEDQKAADERIPLLLKTPAVKQFVSYEPALGLVDFRRWLPRIDWLIAGGESGPGARECHAAWLRSAVEQCREFGTACFVKQMGRRLRLQEGIDYTYGAGSLGPYRKCLTIPVGPLGNAYFDHPKGGDPAEWPEDLKVREFPP